MFGTPVITLTSQVKVYMLPAILEPVTIIDTSGSPVVKLIMKSLL